MGMETDILSLGAGGGQMGETGMNTDLLGAASPGPLLEGGCEEVTGRAVTNLQGPPGVEIDMPGLDIAEDTGMCWGGLV